MSILKSRTQKQLIKQRRLIKKLSVGALSGYLLLGSVGSIAASASVLSATTKQSNSTQLESSTLQVAIDSSLFVEEALSVANEISDVELKRDTLANIAVAYAEKGDAETARTVIQQTLNVTEDSEPISFNTLNAAAEAYLIMGEEETTDELLSQSLDALGEITRGSRNYYALTSAIKLYGEMEESALAKSGLERSTQIATDIKDDTRRLNTFGRIAIAYSTLDDPAIAEAGISQMTQLIEEQASYALESRLLPIAEAHARKGDAERAIALLDRIVQPDDYSAYIIRQAANIYALLDDSEAAKAGLDKLATAIQVIEDQQHDIVFAISEIANAYISIEEPQAALQLLETALPTVEEIEQSTAAITLLSLLAKTYAQLGETATQQDLLVRSFDWFVSGPPRPEPSDSSETTVPEPPAPSIPGATVVKISDGSPWRALVSYALMQNYAQLTDEVAPEKLDIFLQVAEEDNWDMLYPTYLSLLANAASERGDTELLTQQLSHTIGLLDIYEYGAQHSQLYETVQALAGFAEAYGRLEDKAIATEGLQQLTQAADTLADSRFKRELLSAIALSYAALE